MNQITAPPNKYNFGLEFNYSVWPKSTRLDLVNVPWNNDYRDVVRFADRNALNAYIDGIAPAGITVNDVSYVKPNTPVRLNIPINRAMRYNYLRARNPLQPVPGNDVARDYYYFITDVRYVAPNTTEVVLQLDIWQTFGYDVTFGNCYVERGHIGIANTNAFANFGRDYMTIPEGIDVGTEYQVVAKRNKPVMAWDQSNYLIDKYAILVVSTTDLMADPGTSGDPKLTSAQGGSFFTLPSGANYYVFESYVALQNYLQAMATKPWVTQGIISLTAIPPLARYITGWTYPPQGFALAPTQLLPPKKYTMFGGWRDDPDLLNYIPDRYQSLKKLWTYPYMAIELTMFTGTPLMLKPESWKDRDGTVIERFNPAPPNQRIVISPYKYNAYYTATGYTDDLVPGLPDGNPLKGMVGGDDNGEWVNAATQMNNFPTFAIVNNGAIGYMAANAHGIAFQYRDAGWEQQRALRGNEVSYDQAASGMALANQLTNVGIGADTASTAINQNVTAQKAILSGVGAVAGGVAGGAVGIAGGAASAVMGGINAAIDVNAQGQQLAVRNNAATQANRAQQANMGYVRDTNKSLADWAARGDYENKIAGINAKVRDIALTQPSTSGQVGGEALNILNQNAFVSMRIKMIDQANIRTVGEYWLRYGYAVHKFLKPPADMRCMSKFTYWKLSETYISAAPMPETFKQGIRGMFEKGVTVWSNPADIGNIDIADNAPLEGISF